MAHHSHSPPLPWSEGFGVGVTGQNGIGQNVTDKMVAIFVDFN